MFRRILTLLAILTGLAAVGAPAHAVAFDTGSGVVLAAGAEKPCKGEARECDTAVDQPTGSSRKVKVPKPAPVVRILIPTVQMGVDRAYE